MAKTLCDLKKLLKSDVKSFQKHLVNGTHYCEKCGRVSNDKRRLCRAAKIDATLVVISSPKGE